MTELMSLCKFSLNQKWKLIYKATRDGFGSADFHSKCDSYQNSLVIIKSTKGNVFGGYTEQNWSPLIIHSFCNKSNIFSHSLTSFLYKCIRNNGLDGQENILVL